MAELQVPITVSLDDESKALLRSTIERIDKALEKRSPRPRESSQDADGTTHERLRG